MADKDNTSAAGAPQAFHPTYAAGFRCIGSSCEDTCCRGWVIPLDEPTYNKYLQFAEQPLASIVARNVQRTPDVGAHASRFAQIVPTTTGVCPFFNAERLCGIQEEHGHELLSTTCSVYPRALNRVDGVLEGSLYLSCPEAARMVLLHPEAVNVQGDLAAGEFRMDYIVGLGNEGRASTGKPYGEFQAVRGLLAGMILDRTRPMWQRLLLAGSLCKRLDEASQLDSDQRQAAVEHVLAEHRQVLQQGLLREELDRWPADVALKLKVVLRLTDERVRDKTSGKRFEESFWMFVEGIGSVPGEAPRSDLERYLEAEHAYAAPFFKARPHILENFLLNYMFQNLFPFGRETSIRFRDRSMFEECILMASQFAWVETLLIGAAGQQKESFSSEHVVHVVQSFCRAIEHNPHVLVSITELMTHLGLDNLQGMAALLRN